MWVMWETVVSKPANLIDLMGLGGIYLSTMAIIEVQERFCQQCGRGEGESKQGVFGVIGTSLQGKCQN